MGIVRLAGMRQFMAIVANPTKLYLCSKPFKQRSGKLTMTIFLGVSWAFAFVWLAASVWLMTYNILWGLTICVSTTLFCFYLYLMSKGLIEDARLDYVLELTDSEIIYTVLDRKRAKHCTKMVLIDDISFVEYYPFKDSALAIFHAPYIDLEVPLAPMGDCAQDVIDFLTGKGVPIFNTLCDDKFPS